MERTEHANTYAGKYLCSQDDLVWLLHLPGRLESCSWTSAATPSQEWSFHIPMARNCFVLRATPLLCATPPNIHWQNFRDIAQICEIRESFLPQVSYYTVLAFHYSYMQLVKQRSSRVSNHIQFILCTCISTSCSQVSCTLLIHINVTHLYSAAVQSWNFHQFCHLLLVVKILSMNFSPVLVITW